MLSIFLNIINKNKEAYIHHKLLYSTSAIASKIRHSQIYTAYNNPQKLA